MYDIDCVAARWTKVSKICQKLALYHIPKNCATNSLLAWQQRCRRARFFTYERRVELGKDTYVCGNSTGIASHQGQLGFYLLLIRRRAREGREPT